MSINRLIDNKDMRDMHTHTHTYTYNGILLNHKKEWNLSFAKAPMALEDIMLSEIKTDRYYMTLLICGI